MKLQKLLSLVLAAILVAGLSSLPSTGAFAQGKQKPKPAKPKPAPEAEAPQEEWGPSEESPNRPVLCDAPGCVKLLGETTIEEAYNVPYCSGKNDIAVIRHRSGKLMVTSKHSTGKLILIPVGGKWAGWWYFSHWASPDEEK